MSIYLFVCGRSHDDLPKIGTSDAIASEDKQDKSIYSSCFLKTEERTNWFHYAQDKVLSEQSLTVPDSHCF